MSAEAPRLFDNLGDPQGKELRKAFLTSAKSMDSSISKDGLVTALNHVGQWPSMVALKQILTKMGLDGHDTFAYKEFVKVVTHVVGAVKPDDDDDDDDDDEDEDDDDGEMALREALWCYDTSGLGYVTPSDIRSILQSTGQWLTDEDVEQTVALIVAKGKGDGRIAIEDFISALKSQ